MASTTVRRPLPALISLLALLALTGIVWWRVANRTSPSAATVPCPSSSPSSTSQAATLPAPGSITLQVVNATARAGLAGKVRITLQQYGFQVPANAANDPLKQTIPAVAQLRFGPTGRQAAALLAYYLPGAVLVPNASTNATVVVALGEKYQAVASQAAVDAALKAAKVTVSSAAPSPAPVVSSSAGC